MSGDNEDKHTIDNASEVCRYFKVNVFKGNPRQNYYQTGIDPS